MVKKLICILLALILTANFPLAFAVSQSEIDRLQQQKAELERKKAEKQNLVDELEAQHGDVYQRKLAMDERNQYAIEQMYLVSQEIELCSQMIEEKSKEVEQAKEMEQEQLDKYRSRVRAMEENGEMDFIGLVLQLENLAQLITLADDMGEIMEYDRRLEDEYIAAREYAQLVQEEYEKEKAELEAKQEKLREEQKELEAQIEEASLLIIEIQQQIDGESEELEKLNAAMENTQNEIDSMVAELEAQRLASAGGAGTTGGTVSMAGSFGWPTPSCTYITSKFGPRYHPVTGAYQSTHAGLDIGAAAGAEITASAAGTVSCAGVKGGYGNCVMIDHGGGYYTLYGHMSSIAVSYGQSVAQGDVIGYVGSTGVTTGPHLHFEIRINGACTDPATYFGGLTYAPDA